MQSIEYKRPRPRRIGLAIAVVSSLVITFTGAGMIFDDDTDNGSSNPKPVVSNVQQPAPVYSDAFIEMNTNLPDASDDRALTTAEGEPLEQDVTSTGTIRSAILSYDTMLFLEQNTMLPGTSAPSVISSEMQRFLEMNELPEGNASYLPVPIAVPYGGYLTEY